MHDRSEVIHGHVISQILRDNGMFPNNPRLPLLLYKGALLLHPDDEAESILERFSKNNWTNGWKNGIYDYHHYHSNTHEVLGVFCGVAEVQFGGPGGICAEINRGDIVVIPAGVAHMKLTSGGDFLCVGAYPEGCNYDINYGKEGERPGTDENIKNVPLPQNDPLFGKDGPVTQHWGI